MSLSIFSQILSNIHLPISEASVSGKAAGDVEDPELYQPGLPVVSFRLSKKFREENPNVQQRWIQVLLHP